MAKKEINTAGLSSILGTFAPENKGHNNQPAAAPDQIKEPAGEGAHRGRPVGSGKEGPARRPFSAKIREDHYEMLASVAYWDRKNKQDILDEALEAYFEKSETIKEHKSEFQK